MKTESERKYLQFLLTCRKLSNIQRLSTYRLYNKYNVAEHSLYVAQISYLLALDIKDIYPSTKISLEQILALSIFHDVPECLSGDILYTSKKFIDEESLVRLDSSVTDIIVKNLPHFLAQKIKDICLVDHMSRTLEKDIVKFSDMCELGVYLYEEIKNNNTMKSTGIFERVLDILKKYRTYELSPMARKLVDFEFKNTDINADFV